MPLTLAAVAALSFGVVTNSAYAEVPSVVKAAESATSITVEVPADGDDLTYTFDGEEFTVKAGTTATIPTGASNIKIPANTLIAVVTKQGGKTLSTEVFKVETAITLTTLSTSSMVVAGFTPVSSSSNEVQSLLTVVSNVQQAANTESIATDLNSTDEN